MSKIKIKHCGGYVFKWIKDLSEDELKDLKNIFENKELLEEEGK